MNALEFRFDRGAHVYTALDTGEELPHITGMLERTGWIDDLWFTEESSDRGTAVHELTADYDLGALDPAQCVSKFRGYLLAYVEARRRLPGLEILAVEEPIAHPYYRFGGRPDRDVVLDGLRATLEIKSGEPQRSHEIQTALQAILIASRIGPRFPAHAIGRYCLYVRAGGGLSLEQHVNRGDFDEAREVIRKVCGR